MIVSNDGANATAQRLGRGVVTIVPITSNTLHVYPFQTMLPAEKTGLTLDSTAQAEQVRPVALGRTGPLLGTLPCYGRSSAFTFRKRLGVERHSGFVTLAGS